MSWSIVWNWRYTGIIYTIYIHHIYTIYIYIIYTIYIYTIFIPYIYHIYTYIHIYHLYTIYIPYIYHTYTIHIPYIYHTYIIHIPSYTIHIPYISYNIYYILSIVVSHSSQTFRFHDVSNDSSRVLLTIHSHGTPTAYFEKCSFPLEYGPSHLARVSRRTHAQHVLLFSDSIADSYHNQNK